MKYFFLEGTHGPVKFKPTRPRGGVPIAVYVDHAALASTFTSMKSAQRAVEKAAFQLGSAITISQY